MQISNARVLVVSAAVFAGMVSPVDAMAQAAICRLCEDARPVGFGASAGPVVVDPGDLAGTGVPFSTTAAGSVAGAVTRASDGSPVADATVQLLAAGIVRADAVTSGSGTYSETVDPGVYDIRVLATGFALELRQQITVDSSATTTIDVALFAPGSLIGMVMRETNFVRPLAGAAVTVYAGSRVAGTAITGAGGTYSVPGLHPGSYTVRASSASSRAAEQMVSIVSDTTTTADFSLRSGPLGSVQYLYDAAGRLTQVTDAFGDSAVYRYDASGNIVAIERPGAGGRSKVAISAVTPMRGPAGTAVRIAGSGFSPVPQQNTATFNGVAAPVADATATELAVTVPFGATSGPIAVSAPDGTAATAEPFIVTADSGVPTISAFAPAIGVAGTPISITGANFDATLPNDRVALNVTPVDVVGGSPSMLSTSIPRSTLGGRLSVATPAGVATSAADLFVVPQPHGPDDVATTSRTAIGASRSVSVEPAGKIALLLFDADAGQQVAIRVTDVRFTGDCYVGSFSVRLLGPYGASQAAGFGCPNGAFVDQQTLPASGTYTIMVEPVGANHGSLTLTVLDATDLADPIVMDGPAVPVSITTPGQNARLRFMAAAGQLVSVTSTSGVWTSCQFGGQYDLGIIEPDGTTLRKVSNACGPTTIVDHQPLLAPGIYTVWLDPYRQNTGTATIALYSIEDVTGPIEIDGPGVPVAIVKPGQTARLTFAGIAGQVIRATSTSSVWTSCLFGGQYQLRGDQAGRHEPGDRLERLRTDHRHRSSDTPFERRLHAAPESVRCRHGNRHARALEQSLNRRRFTGSSSR